MRDLDDLFAALTKSKFRGRQRLRAQERAYLEEKTLPVVLEHARQFISDRLAQAVPRNDGRQTPMRGHPVFIAQHATATCCRGCLAKWHGIGTGNPLSADEVDYLLRVIARWLVEQSSARDVQDSTTGQRSSEKAPVPEQRQLF